MSAKLFMEYSEFAILIIGLVILTVMAKRRLLKTFAAVAGLVGTVVLSVLVFIPLLFFRKYLGISVTTSYAIFFTTELVSLAAETEFMIAIVYNVFHIAMRPMPGLHKLGKIVFGWASVVSGVLACAAALGPQLIADGTKLTVMFIAALERIQEATNILVLCLVLFVCFATKPLGLSFRSRTFGVMLGLGINSTVQLVQAAWLSTTQAQSVYSPIYLVGILGTCVAFGVWGTYFALPEPERRMILLPTTSPWFFWNRLSEALGDNPGHVAVAGFKPSPAEISMWSALSKRGSERRENERGFQDPVAPIAVNR